MVTERHVGTERAKVSIRRRKESWLNTTLLSFRSPSFSWLCQRNRVITRLSNIAELDNGVLHLIPFACLFMLCATTFNILHQFRECVCASIAFFCRSILPSTSSQLITTILRIFSAVHGGNNSSCSDRFLQSHFPAPSCNLPNLITYALSLVTYGSGRFA
jgi:hypothetical protein